MRSAAEVSEALALSATGLSDREVSQITGVTHCTAAEGIFADSPTAMAAASSRMIVGL